MKSVPASVRQYLMGQVREDGRALFIGSRDGIVQAVVIPALAEKESLFETLLGLSANDPEALGRTLALCVINNRREGVAESRDIENNRETIALLRALIHGGEDSACPLDAATRERMHRIKASGLRLACLDASSRGMEMPDKGGGVGLARKLGLDRALGLLDFQTQAVTLLLNLDADTWVEPGYLSAVRRHFEKQGSPAAVVGFSHLRKADHALSAAVCCYEIYLRYYVMGLRFAGSPYAFHSIGSTMVCTPESYAAVRGMNRREAAEDFYFLNKLAKLGPVASIDTTTVYPSARPSRRVPFGTGQRIIRFLEGGRDEYRLYDPEVFRILRQWLEAMRFGVRQDAEPVLAMAAHIHPLLRSFLESNGFQEIWPRIRRNHRDPDALARQFPVWFDGFKTYKLVRYLTERGYPQVDMFAALCRLLDMRGIPFPAAVNAGTRSNLADQIKILNIIQRMN